LLPEELLSDNKVTKLIVYVVKGVNKKLSPLSTDLKIAVLYFPAPYIL
jgi:hypothetical protein